MVFQTEAEEKAEQFVEQVKSLLRSQDGLIYAVDSSIDTPNVISPSTVANRDAWVEVTLFNVSDPDNTFPAHIWVRLGEIGADIDTYSGSKWNDYKPTIEFHKRFDG